MPANVIEVRIWNKRVGAVAQDPRSGAYAFEYDKAWIRNKIELAPIEMPLERGPSFVFPSLPPSFKGLPGLISDALPDDFGNALITAWLASKGIPKSSITILDRLAYMGRRGMGALEFHPASGQFRKSSAPLQMKKMVEAAREVLKGNFDGDVEAQAALANIIQVGTSAGGARAKAVIAWNPDTQEIRSGQFDVDEGFEHWLLKFDGVGKDMELGTSADYGRIEYAYHLMALEAGIEMAPCRLLHENDRAHFMTKRFDRDGNGKHHMQSLCAIAHMDYKQRGTHSYEQLFMTLKPLRLGDGAVDQVFARMVFNVITRNCDDHTKNFSFIHRQDGQWELSPAYDVTHAHNPSGEWTAQHLMSVNGKFDEITEADMLIVAQRFSVRSPAHIIERVKDAAGRWPAFSKEAGISAAESARVAQDFTLI